MKNPARTGTMIAIAAAGLFASACTKTDGSSEAKPAAAQPAAAQPAAAQPAAAQPAAAQPAAAEKTAAGVHCQGINACKGHGGCKSTANACAGQNGCKGQSFATTATADDCKGKGGTVIAATM